MKAAIIGLGVASILLGGCSDRPTPSSVQSQMFDADEQQDRRLSEIEQELNTMNQAAAHNGADGQLEAPPEEQIKALSNEVDSLSNEVKADSKFTDLRIARLEAAANLAPSGEASK